MKPPEFQVAFTLKSDAVFGSASRSSTLVDTEVQYDDTGCPYLPGRTLKGVLREECANILFALSLNNSHTRWVTPAIRLFGVPGMHDKESILKINDANLSAAVRKLISDAVRAEIVTRNEVLTAMTSIRKQTRVDDVTGAAKDKSLRSIRTIIREISFYSRFQFTEKPEDDDLGLLYACVHALRRIGTNRNRGMGELSMTSLSPGAGETLTGDYLTWFSEQICGKTGGAS